MRNLILLLCLISINIKGQNIQVIDITTNKGIENVNIFNDKNGVSSDNKGNANLSSFKEGALVKMQHISYEDKEIRILKESQKIFLIPKTNLLNEITLSPPTKALHNLKNIESIPVTQNLATSKTATQILQTSLGINVQQSQAGGGSPNFRGMEANRLLLVVDGNPLNNAIYRSGHVQSSSTINPFFLEDISILSAPSSIAYGGGAMGGAILFRTKKPQKNTNKKYFHQQFESSSNSVLTNFLSYYSSKKSASIIGFSVKSIGDLRMGKKRSHGFSNWGKEDVATEGSKQLFTGYKQYDFIHKTDFNLSDSEILSLNFQFSTSSKINRFDKLNDIKNGERKYDLWYYGPQKRIFQSISYINKKEALFFNEQALNLAFQNVSESRHHKKKSDLLTSNRYENVFIYDASLDLKKKLNSLTISYGGGARKQFVHSDANKENSTKEAFYNTTRYPDGGSKVNDIFTYLQLSIPINKRAFIYSGVRYNNNHLSASFQDTITYQFPFTSIDNKNSSLISSILLNYKLRQHTNLSISWYNGFRNPNIDDIGKVFSKNDTYVVIPNKDLSPEISNNLELGINKKFRNATISVYAFHTQLNNAISRTNSSLNGQDSIVYDGETMRVQMNKNIDFAKINGVSFYIKYLGFKNVKLSYKCNYIKGQKPNNQPLAHIPPFNSVFQVDYNLKNHTLQLYSLYNGTKTADEYDEAGVDNFDEATIDGNPSWSTININYTNKLDQQITFGLGLENLLDTHYKTFGSGISSSGRNFTISLHANF